MCVGNVTFLESDVPDEFNEDLVSGASLQIAACDNKYCNCTGDATDGENCFARNVECNKNGDLMLEITCDTEAVKQYGEQLLRWNFFIDFLFRRKDCA